MKKYLSLLLCIVVLFSLSSCSFFGKNNKFVGDSAGNAVQAGKWSENSFSNVWSNIKFSVPAGFVQKNTQEIREKLQTSGTVYVNGDETAFDAEKSWKLYDALIVSEDQRANVFIWYENAKVNSQIKDLSASKLYDDMSTMYKDIGCEVAKSTSKKIAGTSFLAGHRSLAETTFTDTYILKQDEMFIIIEATYIKEHEANVTAFLDSIVSAR